LLRPAASKRPMKQKIYKIFPFKLNDWLQVTEENVNGIVK
jgi:hypothetical protein